jgi:hypothetical protein
MPRNIADYAERAEVALLGDAEAQLYAFSVCSLFARGGETLRLFRGHRTFSDVPAGELLAAARRGGHYLVTAVGPDGRFAYSYRPKTAEEGESYNILRHAGTLHSMLELYEVTGSLELLEASTRALGFLMTCVQPAPGDADAACIVEDGFTKLGGTALAAIALARYELLTGDVQHRPVLLRLGRRILSQVDPDGRTVDHKVSYPDGRDVGFVSDYYPGQAILALVRIQRVDGGAAWLEAAERAARYLIARDRDVPESRLEHDHWLLYALDELQRARPDPSYVEHTRRLARAITMDQIRESEPPDWLGGYSRPPRSTPTATRSEGLCAAYRVLAQFGQPEDAAACLEAVRLGILFQLQTQFGPESALYLPDPARALGGFHDSLENYEIRIDFVQHNISALLGYHHILAGGAPVRTPPRGDATLAEFPAWIRQHLAGRVWQNREQTPQLNRETLLQSLRQGRRFMINNQKPEGNFNYEYDFVKRTFAPDDNSVRQAGATWGLALLNRHEHGPETRAALDRALRFFFRHTQPGPVEGSRLIVYPGESECSTGAVALVALAVIESLRAPQTGPAAVDESWRLELKEHLAGYLGFLKFMRLDSGHFSREYNLRTRSRSPLSSPYSDGEALLCWTRAARYLGHDDLRPLIEESALAMAQRYTLQAWRRDADSDDTKGFFQWGCMAFWEYHHAGWNQSETIADTLLSLAWWMIYTHKTHSRARNTAYAYEGFIPALTIARMRGDQAAAADLAHTIDTGLFKLTSWQVGGPLANENPFLKANPSDDPLAVGGVMNHSREAALRIDVTQHQMHAVILALEHVYLD